jgi:AraC-like DNA-binding protein
MYYQNTFQQQEPPSQAHLSCYTYAGDPNGNVSRHCHSYYEISYIIRGKRYEILNNSRYEVGDNSLFFIPPLVVHNLNNITDVEDVVIQFDHQFLRNSSSLFENRYLIKPAKEQGAYFQLEPSDDICQIFKSIKQFCHMRDVLADKDDTFSNEKFCLALNINSLCLQLISLLLSEKKLMIDINGVTYSDIISLNPIINEILDHPEKPIRMQEASRTVGMSYSHFSRFFEKITGFHYANFNNLLRIHRAEELLLTTSLPISEVAAAIGIDTISYFTRLFKQINGEAPSSYRRKYQIS